MYVAQPDPLDADSRANTDHPSLLPRPSNANTMVLYVFRISSRSRLAARWSTCAAAAHACRALHYGERRDIFQNASVKLTCPRQARCVPSRRTTARLRGHMRCQSLHPADSREGVHRKKVAGHTRRMSFAWRLLTSAPSASLPASLAAPAPSCSPSRRLARGSNTALFSVACIIKPGTHTLKRNETSSLSRQYP